jgi:hypothetical protein
VAKKKTPIRLETKERLLAVRVPERLLAALDEHLASMRAEVPWVSMTRSDAVRWLLDVALRSKVRPDAA